MSKFKVNLVGELEEKKAPSIQTDALQKLTSDVKLLMAGNEQEHLNIARSLKLDHNIAEVEGKLGISLEREKFDSQFGGKTFSADEVKALCIDYDLRLLPTKMYLGTVDSDLFAKVREFCDKSKLRVDAESDRFFIMAPTQCFKFEDEPSKPIPVKHPDPVLFYKINTRTGEPDMYKMIHKWGNDFTILRYARSFRKRSVGHSLLHLALMLSIVFNCIVAFSGDSITIWSVLGCIGLGFVCSLIYHMVFGYLDDNEGWCMNDQLWDSPYRNISRSIAISRMR